MSVRVQGVIIDCADPHALAAFWSRILHAPVGRDEPIWATVDAANVRIAFQQVPEPKASPKNRVHLDLDTDDLAGSVAHAREAGATVLTGVIEEGEGAFVVLQDPEANEFCFVSGYTS